MTVPEILDIDVFDDEWAVDDYDVPMAVDTQCSLEEADVDHVAEEASTEATESSDEETEEGLDEDAEEEDDTR